jgi:glycosyltransferase involved in cell wall biosynthesis
MEKKILHVLSSNIYSGAENVAATLISNLSDQYDMAYTSPNGRMLKTALQERGIQFIPMDDFSIKNIRRIIKQFKPDIIHAHDFTATILCLIAGFNMPVVSHIHQNPNWLKKINPRSIIFLLACIKISKVIGVTSAIKDSPMLQPILKKKMCVIENIGDIRNIRSKAYGVTNEDFDLVFMGRLVDVKDPLRFINIVAKIVEKKPDLKVVIIGDGSLRDMCQMAIRQLSLENNVIIKGFLSNPFPLINNSKILVMTSKSEGLPMSLVEAFALGKPVFVPNIDGIDKIVDKDCGFICKEDIEFINGINNLLYDNNTYFQMSKCAKLKAEKLFNMNDYKMKFIEVYSNVISS